MDNWAFGLVALLASVTLAVVVARIAVEKLRTYGEATKVSNSERMRLAALVRRWRIAAHLTSMVALSPLVFMISVSAKTHMDQLATSALATLLGALLVFGVKQIVRIPLIQTFKSDVSIYNQFFLSVIGFGLLLVAVLIWLAARNPQAAQEAFRILLSIPKPEGQ